MSDEHETASFFERMKKGMEESIAYSRGEVTLKTTSGRIVNDDTEYENIRVFEADEHPP